jgi:tetratricopeptide (TPR) repeat protein
MRKRKRKTQSYAPMAFRLVLFLFLAGCTARALPLETKLNTPEHHVRSGMRLLAMGRYADALREFELTKEVDSTFSKAYVGSGLAWSYRGDSQKGLKDLQRAEELATSNEEKIFVNVGFVRLYLIDRETTSKGWLQQAESAYKNAVAIKPNAPEAHYYMAEAYLAAGQWEKARKLFQKVLAIGTAYIGEAHDALQSIEREKERQHDPS